MRFKAGGCERSWFGGSSENRTPNVARGLLGLWSQETVVAGGTVQVQPPEALKAHLHLLLLTSPVGESSCLFCWLREGRREPEGDRLTSRRLLSPSTPSI